MGTLCRPRETDAGGQLLWLGAPDDDGLGPVIGPKVGAWWSGVSPVGLLKSHRMQPQGSQQPKLRQRYHSTCAVPDHFQHQT